jgi:protein DJ-1
MIAVPIDILRRAGVDVTVAGLENASPVKGANNMILTPEIALADVKDFESFDMIVLPGGTDGAR